MELSEETRKDSGLEPARPAAGTKADVLRAEIGRMLFGDEADAAPRIGHYELRESIGSGGMGVVHSAWDPKLQRTVAIKLLSPEGTNSTRQRERIHREAQALAKLSHPNVVHVYEVGEHEEKVFLVMELIEGLSLQDWQAEQQREPRELWAKYRQAAAGLTAAHQAGLIHRDFKPANVVVGHDGRVRVVDFGLAAGPGLSMDSKTPASGDSVRGTSSLTRTGTVVGTPAYMAPEQLRGHKADATSDQFAFSVSLVEALTGRRPYTTAQLQQSHERNLEPLVDGVPWLWARTLRRGLNAESTERWPTMASFVEALDRYVFWGRVAKVSAVPLLLASALVTWLAVDEADLCDDVPSSLSNSWNETRAKKSEDAFKRTDLPFAHDAWNSAQTKADEYATRWAGARAQICEASSEPTTQDALRCLRGEAARFDALIEEYEAVTPDNLSTIYRLPSMLRNPTECREPTAQMSTPTRAILNELARAEAAVLAGRYEVALPRLKELASKPSLEGRPALALVWRLRGEALRKQGDPDDAEAAFATAIWVSSDSHTKAVSTVAWLRELVRQERWASVQDGVKLLEPLLDGHANDQLRADVLDILGESALHDEGDVLRAIGLHEDALAKRKGDGRARAATRLHLANALSSSQDEIHLDLAQSEYDQLLEHYKYLVGERHPLYASVLFDLGVLAKDRQDYEKALELVARASRIEDDVLPPTSLQRVRTAVIHGHLLIYSGDREGALEKARWAWERSQSLPEDNSDYIAALRLIASTEMETGHYEEAAAHHRRIARTPEGASDPILFQTLAWLSCQLDRFDECSTALTTARAKLAEIEEMPQAMRELLELYFRTIDAQIELGRGRPSHAIAIIESIESAAATLRVPEGDAVLQMQLAKLQPELDQLRARASVD